MALCSGPGLSGRCRPAVQGQCAKAARAAARGVLTRAQASRDEAAGSKAGALPAMLLAAAVVFAPLDATFAPPARADEALSPFEQRQRDLEKRRELMRQAREKAEGKAGAPAAAPEAEPEPVGPKTDLKESAKALRAQSQKQYESLTKNRPSLPKSVTEPENEALDPFKGLFSKKEEPAPPAPAAAKPAPAPAPAAPAPKPKPTPSPPPPPPAPKPAPIVAPRPAAPIPAPARPPPPPPAPVRRAEPPKKQEAPKPAPAKQAGKQKRRGPLPLWLAQFAVFGAIGGATAAAAAGSDEISRKIMGALGALEKKAAGK
ncbi:hypothetical protein Rsub_07018 [Raphidocelis subcapitata]|uniref:Uncharacterized protein n=1 Tax=Raphidocelis subcapitata TaxID=307507 RepID=A0A2V0P3P6_9CHLO|nr:hypothetical protein Rsub_07018 [Raphidocelis subcapitata]|eukprot:GBF94484.1 hypothetical protein Rsub_07018 [Raphidocelis subcapitata]